MRTRSPGQCVACVAVAVVVVVAACMLLVEASRGDEEPVFVSCVANCERTSCRGEHAKSPTLHLRSVGSPLPNSQPSPATRPYSCLCVVLGVGFGVSRLMGWTCEENCRYECMHQVSDMKDERGEQLVCTRGLLAVRHNADALATSPSLQTGVTTGAILWQMALYSRAGHARAVLSAVFLWQHDPVRVLPQCVAQASIAQVLPGSLVQDLLPRGHQHLVVECRLPCTRHMGEWTHASTAASPSKCHKPTC